MRLFGVLMQAYTNLSLLCLSMRGGFQLWNFELRFKQPPQDDHDYILRLITKKPTHGWKTIPHLHHGIVQNQTCLFWRNDHDLRGGNSWRESIFAVISSVVFGEMDDLHDIKLYNPSYQSIMMSNHPSKANQSNNIDSKYWKALYICCISPIYPNISKYTSSYTPMNFWNKSHSSFPIQNAHPTQEPDIHQFHSLNSQGLVFGGHRGGMIPIWHLEKKHIFWRWIF